MTEDAKKPGAEAAGQPDPLSATGMFLNAIQAQPDQPVDQPQESAAKLFAAEGKTGATSGAQRAQPFSAPPARSSPAGLSPGEDKPSPGEFTQMFQKLEFAAPPQPTPQASSTAQAGASPEFFRQEPGEFTRMFVAATASLKERPAPAAPDPSPFAPPPTPRVKGFSTPGASDSASADGSFTQLFRTPPASPAPPVRPFTPLASAPANAVEPAWPSSLDSAPSRDAVESGGATRLFRSLSAENEPPGNRFGEQPESLFGAQNPQPAMPSTSAPGSITMLIQKLNEDLQAPASSLPPSPAAAPEPAGFSGPGEFTRIISGGFANPAAGSGVSAEKVATPAPAPQVFPASIPPAAPLPPAPAFAAPQAPAIAVPKAQAPPAQPPKVAASAPPPQSKFQQMLPMLLVLNAFLLVVLIVLVVFALKSK